ncbi:MAG: hypothetical protein ACPLPT_05580 [Moorellales bacterium]
MKGPEKIVRKSSAWWRHGKHGARLEVALFFNRLKSRRRNGLLEELDVTASDWSSRRRR